MGVRLWPIGQIQTPPPPSLGCPAHQLPSTYLLFPSLKSPQHWTNSASAWQLTSSYPWCAWADTAACISPASLTLVQMSLMAHLWPPWADTSSLRWPRATIGMHPKYLSMKYQDNLLIIRNSLFKSTITIPIFNYFVFVSRIVFTSIHKLHPVLFQRKELICKWHSS